MTLCYSPQVIFVPLYTRSLLHLAAACMLAELGRLMARYCVAFESMKRFLNFDGKETLPALVSIIYAQHYGLALVLNSYSRSLNYPSVKSLKMSA